MRNIQQGHFLGRRAFSNTDLRDQPAYPLAEAARYLKLPSATLSAWISGRVNRRGGQVLQSGALIRPPTKTPPVLSFWNLIEAHVLRALRTHHRVSLKAVRDALRYAEDSLGIERLLLSRELCTDSGRLFLQIYGDLIELSASGQIAMQQVFDQHLRRVEWGEWDFPVRLYPFVASDVPASEDRAIAIDPAIAFGRPIVVRCGISTRAIAERIDAGESMEDLAEDYELDPAEIASAVLYERSA